MIYGTIEKEVEFECSALDKYDTQYLEAPIEENFDTIKAYLFEKRFDVAYSPLSWVLEKGAREFMYDLEDKWNHNQIDTYELYHNEEFLEFVKNYEKLELDEQEFLDMFEEFYEECREDLTWNYSKQELKDLKDEYHYGIDVSGHVDDWYEERDIDIDEILEDYFDDEEDEEVDE